MCEIKDTVRQWQNTFQSGGRYGKPGAIECLIEVIESREIHTSLHCGWKEQFTWLTVKKVTINNVKGLADRAIYRFGLDSHCWGSEFYKSVHSVRAGKVTLNMGHNGINLLLQITEGQCR